ncbi:hypothetical protein Tco_0976561 [Tanacetum coccineum]|uniref:Uncharacterized protein n=1 Tax=Tanacetum coccineum TaxID=301880 RepID=A0ABQ5EHJ9_9ASTR
MAYPFPSDTAYPDFCPIQLRMTEVIKREFEKIKDVKAEDVPLICDASLEVFNDKIRGDDEVKLTGKESSDNDDEIAEVFRIDTNIFDYETPICLTFNEFNYHLKDYEWYEALEDCKLKDETLRNKAIMEGSIKEDDESRYKQKRQWNTYTNYDDAYEINHEHNKSEELYEIQEQPIMDEGWMVTRSGKKVEAEKKYNLKTSL